MGDFNRQISTPKGWYFSSLTDLISNVVDNRGKSVPTSKYGVPLIATNCIKNDALFPVKEKIRYVTAETYKNWFRAHPKPGDIIIVNKGTPGLVCMVPDPVDFCFAQDMIAIRPDEKKIFGRYLFAALRSSNFTHQVSIFNVGTTIPHLKKSDFHRLLIPIPPRNVQESIGDLYYNFSYKIEVNRHINQTLEQMARALYKHWFVDFEPFQDTELEETELGMIPKGWKISLLEDVCMVNALAITKSNVPEIIQYVDISSVGQGIVNETKMISFDQAPSRAQRIVKDGDVVWSMVRPGRKSYFLALDPEKNTIVSTGFAVITPKNIPFSWVYLALTTEEFVNFLVSNETGATYPAVVPDVFKKAKFIIPPEPVLSQFHSQIEPLLRQINSNNKENLKLRMQRDYLLPKLLSGEIEPDSQYLSSGDIQ